MRRQVGRFVLLYECLLTHFYLGLDTLLVKHIALVVYGLVLVVADERMQMGQLNFQIRDVGHGHELVTLSSDVASVQPTALLLAHDLHQQSLNLLNPRLVHQDQLPFRLYQNFI